MPAHILVVDPEPELQVLISRRFRQHIRLGEFSFLYAHDGEQALEVVRDEPALDMVLSDIDMPGIDGLSFLKHLKALNPQLQAVVISAHGDLANIRSAMNAGAFDFVGKPVVFRDLEATIRKTLAETAWLRRLARERSLAEAQRLDLARHFPPGTVNRLAGIEDPFGVPTQRTVAVLCVDMLGFGGVCAHYPTDAVFALLRDFHARLASSVFRHGGTVERHLDDGLMASFGIPRSSALDASNALHCALAMHAEMDALNRGRRLGDEPIRIGVGIHHGPVCFGNIGDSHRLELVSLGDTVDLATRLERLTRPLAARVVLSQALFEAILQEQPRPPAVLSGFHCITQHPIPGRRPMTVHVLERS